MIGRVPSKESEMDAHIFPLDRDPWTKRVRAAGSATAERNDIRAPPGKRSRWTQRIRAAWRECSDLLEISLFFRAPHCGTNHAMLVSRTNPAESHNVSIF